MNSFVICRDGKAFGTAQCFREGLYFRISVRCPESVRIFLHGEKNILDLGICVPMDNQFGIETRVPVKRIGERVMDILTEETFYPVSQDKPFSRLYQLRSSVFTVLEGSYGVQKVISSPTGQ